MSGGFFRGTTADQDTRFSNKQAKLMKSQKFAPELEHLVDMTKVKFDVVRPWIAKRVTELLGFEDEVLINFIYGLLDGKNVNGKEIQIAITGFMEKNTGKFMKELWTLLLSAQKNASGVPQQFLDEKEEETKKKMADVDRITNEIQRKKEREADESGLNQQKTDGGPDTSRTNDVGDKLFANHRNERATSNSPDERNEIVRRNGRDRKARPSRSSHSAERSPSPSRHMSKSRSPKARKRSISTERERPTRRRSISPHYTRSSRRSPSLPRRRSSYRQRSGSRSRSRSLSPRRFRSFRHTSPYARRRRSPSPVRRRSPSPVRHRSPSPVRRRSPPPVRRRSPSPVSSRSPSPVRRRSPTRRSRRSPSPVRRRSPFRRSRSPARRSSRALVKRQSLSPVQDRSPLLPPRKGSSSSPSQDVSPSPKQSYLPSHSRRSPSPSRRRLSSPRHQRTPSPMTHERPNQKSLSESRRPLYPDQSASESPVPQRSTSLSREKSPAHSKNPISSKENHRYPNSKVGHKSYKETTFSREIESSVNPDKEAPSKEKSRKNGASFSESQARRDMSPEDEDELRSKRKEAKIRKGSPLKNSKDTHDERETRETFSERGSNAKIVDHEKGLSLSEQNKVEDGGHHLKPDNVSQKLSKNDSSDSGYDDGKKRKHKGTTNSREVTSDDDSSDTDEIKNAKRRKKKEEKRLRREKRRQRHEEKRRKKEERRSEKHKPRKDEDPSIMKKVDEKSDIEEEDKEKKQQLEIELRKKALESLKAKKGYGH